MHIFEEGAIFKNSKSGKLIECSVLVADIFELNTDLKAMLVIDLDTNNYGYTEQEKTIAYMDELSKCDIFECEATAMGNIFKCIFTDVIVEANYGNGSVIRAYLKVEDYEHQECRPIQNNYDTMIKILNDEDIYIG